MLAFRAAKVLPKRVSYAKQWRASGIDMLQTQSQIASTSSVTLRSSLAGKKTRREGMIEMRNSILGVKRATNAGTR